MKKKRFLTGMIMLEFLCALITGCQKDFIPGDQRIITIVKLKQVEYKYNVLANYLEGSDSIVLTRGNGCGESIGSSGYSPYWELPDNWLLVDWKWSNFPYDAGLTLLTEKRWENIDYTDNQSFAKWPISEPHISQPVEKIYYIHYHSLEKYCHSNYNNLLKDIEEKAGEDLCYCCAPDEMDKLWKKFQEDVSSLISNNELEKYIKEKEK